MNFSYKYLEKIGIYLRISSHVPGKSLKLFFVCALTELLKTFTHCTLQLQTIYLKKVYFHWLTTKIHKKQGIIHLVRTQNLPETNIF